MTVSYSLASVASTPGTTRGAFSVRKPFSHGVELLANYTWAKAIDGSQVSGQNGTFNGTNPILDPFNLKNPGTLKEYGRSDLDMRGRFVASIVYSPTFGFSNKIYRYAANGWTLSAPRQSRLACPLRSSCPTVRQASSTEVLPAAKSASSPPRPAVALHRSAAITFPDREFAMWMFVSLVPSLSTTT